MPQVSVSVGGRSYLVACDEGQEKRLLQLAEFMDGKVKTLVQSTGQAVDQRLLVMAALLIADELFDLQDGAAGAGAPLPAAEDGERTAVLEEHAAAALEACARRIESLAERVQGA